MAGFFSRRPICAGALLAFSVVAALPAHAQCSASSYPVALPHIAFGGPTGGAIWSTTLLIRNTGSSSASVTVCYFGDSGTALSVPFNGTSVTSSTVTVPANGQAELTPDTTPTSTVAGWAAFAGGLPAGVTAQAVFNWESPAAGICILSAPVQGLQFPASNSQAVAPIVSNPSGTLSMPFDNTNGQVSGYAFANTTNKAVNLTLTFYSESGSELGTYTPAQLPGFGHTEFLLNQSGIPSAVTTAKGVMVLSSSSVYPLGFRFDISGSTIESFSTWLP